MSEVLVRKATPSDLEELSRLRAALWPSSSIDGHAEELESILAGIYPGVLPLVELVAQTQDTLVGANLQHHLAART